MISNVPIPHLKKLFHLIVLGCFPLIAPAQTEADLPEVTPANDSIEFREGTNVKLTLDADELVEYEGAIEKVVNELTNYISLIGDKRNQDGLRFRAIDKAVKLFINEQQIVQVSSLNSETKTRVVREYFSTLYSLPYRNVSITFREVGHLSPLEKGPDGKYNAIYYVLQRFEGCNDDNNCYVDVTTKKVQVTLEMIDKVIGPEIESFLAVKLGNIGVDETKPN